MLKYFLLSDIYRNNELPSIVLSQLIKFSVEEILLNNQMAAIFLFIFVGSTVISIFGTTH